MSTPETPSTRAWWVLVIKREALSRQALDQPQLPERLGAVELLGEDPGRHVAKLLLATRAPAGPSGGRGSSRLKLRVVDPEGAPGLDRRDRRASAGSAARGAAGSRRGRAGRRSSAAAPRRSVTPPTCMWLVGDSLVRNEASTDAQPIHVTLGHGLTYRACRRLAAARRVPPAARQPAPCWRCSRCSRRRRLSAWRRLRGAIRGGNRRRRSAAMPSTARGRSPTCGNRSSSGLVRPVPPPTCARPADWPPSCARPGSRTSGSSARSATWSASSPVAAAATS